MGFTGALALAQERSWGELFLPLLFTQTLEWAGAGTEGLGVRSFGVPSSSLRGSYSPSGFSSEEQLPGWCRADGGRTRSPRPAECEHPGIGRVQS